MDPRPLSDRARSMCILIYYTYFYYTGFVSVVLLCSPCIIRNFTMYYSYHQLLLTTVSDKIERTPVFWPFFGFN